MSRDGLKPILEVVKNADRLGHELVKDSMSLPSRTAHLALALRFTGGVFSSIPTN